MFSNIPQELTSLPNWVCASDHSKAPMRTWELSGARITCKDDWDSFSNAKKSVELGNYDHVGFVLNNNGLVIIDIDDCVEGGAPNSFATSVIKKFNSYTEISKSGTGIHIVVKGDLPFDGKNNPHKGIEIYKNLRYIIITGNVIGSNIVSKRQEEINEIVNEFFKESDCRVSVGSNLGTSMYSPVRDKTKGVLGVTYPTIPNGARNNCLTSYAGMLRNIGFTKTETFAKLLKCNEVACSPKVSFKELQTIVNSVMKYSN